MLDNSESITCDGSPAYTAANLNTELIAQTRWIAYEPRDNRIILLAVQQDRSGMMEKRYIAFTGTRVFKVLAENAENADQLQGVTVEGDALAAAISAGLDAGTLVFEPATNARLSSFYTFRVTTPEETADEVNNDSRVNEEGAYND